MHPQPARRVLSVFLCCLVVAGLFGPALSQATMVRLLTVLGPVDIDLFDSAAPATVANFLGYTRSGAYNNTFFHRSVPGFIVQGGGWSWTDASGAVKVPAGPPVVNEFSVIRSNLRGTVAMAKLGNNPNSATTEWFFNLANNASNLDEQNGGFTVFGRVTTPGMRVVDAIAALSRVNAGSAFTDLPVARPVVGSFRRENFVMVNSVAVLPAPATAADRVFNYLEATYPQFLKPSLATSTTGSGYYYRFYPESNAYVGERDGVIFYLVPAISSDIIRFAPTAELLPTAAQAGY